MSRRWREIKGTVSLKSETLQVRVVTEVADRIFEDAQERDETLSEWLRAAIDLRLAEKAGEHRVIER